MTEPSIPLVVGVCGAGTMGAGIAEVFATAGRRVCVVDTDPSALDRARGKVEANLRRRAAKGQLKDGEPDVIAARLSFSSDFKLLSDVSLVVEAVVEDVALKHEVFRKFEDVCSPSTILATNTSTLSVSEIAAVLKNPGRVAGTHFFNPAPRMRLVELTPGLATRPETVERLRAWLTDAGKSVVLVREFPGGVVSRLQLLVRNEAVRLVAENVATPEDVDTAMKLGSSWPLGPLELIDLVGVDVHVRNSETLAREMGSDRYQPHPLLRQMVRAGKLGRKTGSGFYDYSPDGAASGKQESNPR